MDELTISNLPAEILTEIFRYLNVGDLKNATTICQLWNNLIKSAFRWSLKLEYGWIEHSSSERKNFILTTDRKFGSIEIYGISFFLWNDDQIREAFKRHGFNVVKLKLHVFSLDNLTDIAELLTFTPNLKHAFILTQKLDWSSDVLLMDHQTLPDLKNLKSLMIYGDDLRIIQCFQKAKLTTMDIHAAPENRNLLVDFLSNQDKLTSLAVDPYSIYILSDMGQLNVPNPFRLKQLSISSTPCKPPSDLVRFINSQAGNLTEMEIKYRIPMCVYECLFANMTKLTTLWMTTSHIPRDNDFYDRLKEHRNIHTVRLLHMNTYETPRSNFVGKFFQKVPNVRCLIFVAEHGFLDETILVTAQSLSKLETIYVDKIEALDGVEFPNLKTLHINNLTGKINWNQFTKVHPLLTELTTLRMDNKSYFTSDDIDQITTNVDLQHIRLGTGFVADNRFFEIVGSKCKNLKTLDLHKSCIPQNLRNYLHIDVLRLRDCMECPTVFRSNLIESLV